MPEKIPMKRLENGPMIKLGDSSKAPVLSYNIPEPSQYSGTNLIELSLPRAYFTLAARRKPGEVAKERKKIAKMTIEELEANQEDLVFRKYKKIKGKRNKESDTTSVQLAKALNISTKKFLEYVKAGGIIGYKENLYGKRDPYMYFEPDTAEPRLLVVESYLLSTYPGSYGAGKVIQTFSLLPGEKTKISIKSYTKIEADSKSASSILDSFNETSAKEFEDSLQAESSDKTNSSESFEYHAEAKASASWGWGKAEVSGGVKGGSNSAREQFAKSVSSATQKHTASASSKRDIQINTSYEIKEQSGEETSTERELQNINVGRTLNFVFRQMNQEYNTFLHLVDVKIGFYNGFYEAKREVSLPDIDSLLKEVIIPQQQAYVKKVILDELSTIYDYQDLLQSDFICDAPGGLGYKRINKNLVTKYQDPATGTEHVVPGVIMSVTKSVLRTEGVVVDAFLGQGEGLDNYSKGLQAQAIREKELSNEMLQTEIEKNRLAMKVIEGKDAEAAKLFQQVFPKEVAAETEEA